MQFQVTELKMCLLNQALLQQEVLFFYTQKAKNKIKTMIDHSFT